MHKLLFSLLSFFCLITLFAADLTILQTTDLHGTAGLAMDKHAGITRIATCIDSVRKNAAKDSVILIDTGDLVQGTYSAQIDRGASMVEALNQLKYDVWVPGNHDFDYGTDVFRENVKRFKGAVLTANVRVDDVPQLKSWTLLQRNGHRIAVIGMSPPYLHHWVAEAQLKGLHSVPMEQALAQVMPDIYEAKPDLIVLAIHHGEFASGRLNADGKAFYLSSLLTKYPRIRLTLGGHTHMTVSGKQLTQECWYVQAPALGDGLAAVFVDFSKGTPPRITSESILAADQPEQKDTVAVLENCRQAASAGLSDQIARTEVKLEPVSSKTEPNALAVILCRAMREGVKSEAAFSTSLSKFYKDPGTSLSSFDVFRLAPYENFISTIDLTPAQLRLIIREQQNLQKVQSFMHADGLTWKEDNGKLQIYRTGSGEPLAEDTKVRTAFGSYAVSGAGGRYPVLKKIAESGTVNRIDHAQCVRESLTAYLKRQGTVR